jgi:hypothetical protein
VSPTSESRPTSGPASTTTTSIAQASDNPRKARPPAERIEWTTNGAHVSVGTAPFGAIGLELGDGVTVKITGDLFEIQPGTFLVEEGARVTITGRLSELATLRLTRGAR